ncbi:YoaK family protein [Brevundimonas sp. NPDC049575]|uniref:YoaK family protein n=2 Tax=Brevundimonas TaxID=41275 RepID=UPI003D07235D
MRTLAPSERGMAVLLAALAGYVDSLGFLQLGGLFVSFMSGNSTRMAVGVSMGDWRTVGVAAAILILFVLGAAVGALVAGGEGMRSRSRVLAVEATLLAGAALAVPLGSMSLAVGLMVLAMGIENAVFLRDGEVGVGLTYMTGALVKLGQALAGAVRGGRRTAFAPYLLLWVGLFGGAVVGAFSYGALGLNALWPAATLAAGLAVFARVSREA